MVDKKEKDGDKRKKKNGSDVIKDVDAGYATGYDTDAASTSKSRAKLKKKTKTRKADGYETEDDGYMSTSTNHPPLRKTKSKSRFFKLGNRSKRSIDEDETVRSPVEVTPPVPAPAFRLPIAARFATTLNLDTDNALLDPPIGPLGMPAAQSPSLLSGSPSTPAPGSIHRNAFNDDVESVTSAPAPSITTTASTSKRTIIRFASDSSDNHGTGSSNGHSFLSRFTATSSSSASTTGSMSTPPVKSLNISYPLTRSSSPSSPPLDIQHTILSPPPGRSHAKQTPRPLFVDRIPSDRKKFEIQSNSNSPSEWSPAGSPFVVLSPRPATSPATGSRSHLATPSPGSVRAASPAGSSRDVIPSTDFIVPSPSNDVFVPPSSLSHYDIPPPSPPPTVPLPDVPTPAQQQHSREGRMFEVQQGSYLDSRSPSPLVSPQRGRVSPFPTQPSGTVPIHSGPVRGFEGRMRVKRYRDIYAMPSPKGEMQKPKVSGYASSPETPTFKRKSTNVGISVEQPSDDEDDYDSDAAEVLKNVLRGLTDDGRSAAMGFQRDVAPEAALDRRRSLEVLQNYYRNTAYAVSHPTPVQTENPPRTSFSPYASEDDLSDDKSRYTSDEKHSVYKTNNSSQARSLASGWADDHRWSMSVDGESRASFMDADKSDEARERFVRRIEAMFDESGRELPPNLGIGKNAVVPPVPKIPEGFQTGSKTWI